MQCWTWTHPKRYSTSSGSSSTHLKGHIPINKTLLKLESSLYCENVLKCLEIKASSWIQEVHLLKLSCQNYSFQTEYIKIWLPHLQRFFWCYDVKISKYLKNWRLNEGEFRFFLTSVDWTEEMNWRKARQSLRATPIYYIATDQW